MKYIYYSILCLLLNLCFVACSSSDDESNHSNLTENSILAGTKWILTEQEEDLDDVHVDAFRFYFYSPTEGTFYYSESDSYSDTGSTRRSIACHFRYSMNGNNVMLQYITDEFLSVTRLVLEEDKLIAGDLEFTKKEKITLSDYEWLNTLHGTTGACSWYSNLRDGLWIAGEGAMADYSDYEETPWVKNGRTPNRVVIEEGVTEIGSYAFADPSVGEVEMPDESLIRVGKAAFYRSSIDYIYLSQYIINIEAEAFADCKHLKQINIPQGIVSIGESAFSGTALNEFELEFGSNLRTIGRFAFYGCEASSLTFAEGVQSISTGAFLGDFCGSSKELILPNSLTSIGATAFQGPYKKIVIGSGTAEIGECAFISSASSGEMYVNRSTPPSTEGDIIVSGDEWISAESRWTLYVPKGCKSVYSKIAPWNKFKSIMEDDNLEEGGEEENDNPLNVQITVDGRSSDWDALEEDERWEVTVPDGAAYTAAKRMLVTYSENYVYLYIEYDGSKEANVAILNLYLDTDAAFDADGKATTGAGSENWVNDGTELLAEGYIDNYDPNVFMYAGVPLAGEWNWIDIIAPGTGAIKGSDIMDLENGNTAVEIEFSRSALGLNDEMLIGIQLEKAGWSGVCGALPQQPAIDGEFAAAEKLLIDFKGRPAATRSAVLRP